MSPGRPPYFHHITLSPLKVKSNNPSGAVVHRVAKSCTRLMQFSMQQALNTAGIQQAMSEYAKAFFAELLDDPTLSNCCHSWLW